MGKKQQQKMLGNKKNVKIEYHHLSPGSGSDYSQGGISISTRHLYSENKEAIFGSSQLSLSMLIPSIFHTYIILLLKTMLY